MRAARRIAIGSTLAALAAAAAGCIEGDLEPRSIVQQWRVLAVVVEPPEARPGEDVLLRGLVVDPEGERALHGEDGVRLEWTACIRAEQTPGLGGAQYDPEQPSEACDAADPRLRVTLPRGEDFGHAPGTAVLPGDWTDRLAGSTDALREMFGDDVPVELFDFLLSTTGIQLTIQLSVRRDGETRISAFKRMIVSTREDRGTNPPAPRAEIGLDSDEWVSGRDVSDPFTCVPEDGSVPVVDAGEKIVLRPDPDDDSWAEDYQVLDIEGRVTTASERPFYSWFSTDGSFSQEVTRWPIGEEEWTTPDEAGTYPLWIAVRDGHAGMSACRVDVEVR